MERLLSGHASNGDAELGEVARFFDDVRNAYPEAAADGCEDSHLARMFEAALLAEMGDPAVKSASNANGPETQVAGLPKQRRIEMLKTLVGSTKFKVVAASLALLVASSGTAFAASQGSLPAPVQNAVSGAAAVVGIEVPTADEALELDDQSAVDTGAVGSVDESGTVANDQGDQQDSQADQQDAEQADQSDAEQADQSDAEQADQPDAKADHSSAGTDSPTTTDGGND